MKIFDMHIHAFNSAIDQEKMLKEMDKAGVYGGCIFSNEPKAFNPKTGTSFEERMHEVLTWTKGQEGRLFPVLWIHPDEENIIANLHNAVAQGIAAFKIICNDFYVYEEKCLRVLREIAKLNKPVFFHSGILWDGEISSEYNRPLNWEKLLKIEGLRFSMGHCSWPWVDECIALYGKFLNALSKHNTAEMFFDITPGTPLIDREHLLKKLYNIGYDVGNNIMFGTDSIADKYSMDYASLWLTEDSKILDKYGVSKENREKLYHHNLMRFLGISDETVQKRSPRIDEADVWTPENPEVRNIIQKWYSTLNFPKSYDAQFQEALENIKIADTITAETYPANEKDGKRNLLSFLFLCENLEEKYEAQGISRDVLLDTLNDIVTYTNIWSDLKGELYLGELAWLKKHMKGSLFHLGSLQFAMGTMPFDAPELKLAKGDPMIEIHIPENTDISPAACLDSFKKAKGFFAKHFPEFNYKCFTCHSWLLDRTLTSFLPPESNIIRFQNMFKVIFDLPSDALLRYIFRWDTTMQNVRHAVCISSFAEKVKKSALKKCQFYETFGVLDI